MKKVKTPTAEELAVYNLIPTGRDKAISRKALKVKAGMSDRKVREILENLSYCHLVVCNMGDGKGYFRPKDQTEIEAYVKFLNSYKCTIQKRMYRILQAARKQAV